MVAGGGLAVRRHLLLQDHRRKPLDRLKRNHADVLSFVKSELSSRFNMKDLGPLTHCLGMEVRQDLAGGKSASASYVRCSSSFWHG